MYCGFIFIVSGWIGVVKVAEKRVLTAPSGLAGGGSITLDFDWPAHFLFVCSFIYCWNLFILEQVVQSDLNTEQLLFGKNMFFSLSWVDGGFRFKSGTKTLKIFRHVLQLRDNLIK